MSSILITGGTGSFGNAFVRRCLAQNAYERICIFSRDEWKQQEMRNALRQEFPDLAERVTRWFIGDVRDEERLKQAFNGIDFVVHAAALKQIPACEYNPKEAVLTNICGAMNVIGAAISCKVKKVVALSSDKAIAPINLYGKTKAVAESLFVQGNVYSQATRFACVRYGNILASRGSVIPLWNQQLADTGRIKITSLDMTRFYMTIDEACTLVEDALHDMQGGEIFVPKARSFNIAHLACAWLNKNYRAMLDCTDIVGVRPGEKPHEELITINESYRVLDQGTRFVVLPIAREWAGEIAGKAIGNGFYYASNHSPLYIDDVGKISEWLKTIH